MINAKEETDKDKHLFCTIKKFEMPQKLTFYKFQTWIILDMFLQISKTYEKKMVTKLNAFQF